MMVALLHSNGQLRTERDGDTEKGCQKSALQQEITELNWTELTVFCTNYYQNDFGVFFYGQLCTNKLCHFYFCSIFGFCWRTFLTFFFHRYNTWMTSAHDWNKIYQLAVIALPEYHVKCEQAQFCKNSHRFTYFLVKRKLSLWNVIDLANSDIYSFTLCETTSTWCHFNAFRVMLSKFSIGQCAWTSCSWNCRTAA